jgi:hypothetical protein
VADCVWCESRKGTAEIAGYPFCATCYQAGKKAVYVERRDIDVAIREHVAELRTGPPVEQATAAPGEKRSTKRRP